ncbi:hypothetical protein GCM10010278_34710 [Streptomyces melanogenes]|nr:hypothetical protein GCM10010278_34710 [Streptomyces melanogenes]
MAAGRAMADADTQASVTVKSLAALRMSMEVGVPFTSYRWAARAHRYPPMVRRVFRGGGGRLWLY